jgi:hypothetical protein
MVVIIYADLGAVQMALYREDDVRLALVPAVQQLAELGKLRFDFA